jgi:CheY-like chemotaxis protein
MAIVDMRLPDSSGIDVVRALRSEPELAAIPILMTTGSVQPSDRRAAANAGVDAFISKPFDISRLVNEIERLLWESESYRSALPLRRLH